MAKNIITNINQVDGVENLNHEEKSALLDLIKKDNDSRTKTLPDKLIRKKTYPMEAPIDVRRKGSKPSTAPSINVLFTNADQFTPTKKSELLKRIEKEMPLIMAICEMKPKNAHDRELQDYEIPDFSMHPVNIEPNSSGRGIAIYTHSSIEKSVIQIQPELAFEEACFLEVRLRAGDTLFFGCFYRSPTPSDNSNNNNHQLNELFRCISRKKYTHLCLVGDFNFRDINWKSWTTSHNENSKEWTFIETARDCYLYQHITEPTRKRGNDDPSTIDLLFTNEAMQISSIVHHAPLGKSDHSVICFKYHCYLNYTKPKERFLYDKADFDAIRNNLKETNWEQEYADASHVKNKDQLWDTLKSKLYEMRDQFIPKSTATDKPSWKNNGSVPIGKLERDAIRQKTIAHRRWMSKKRGGDAHSARLEYTRIRNKVKRLMQKAKREFERGICIKSKSDPKSFWWYVRHKLKTKTGVAPLLENIKNPESTTFDDQGKANILQRQFSSVFTREPDGEIPTLNERTHVTINSINVTQEMVRTEILKLNANKSCGPDDIHPRLLIELVDILSGSITLLLNKTLQEGEIPADWKSAYISPIYKKGAKNRAENYRPISLTSIICKIMESFIKEAIMSHLRSENLLSSKQYGFISGRSTVTQLLRYLDKCVETIVDGSVVDSIYLDFQKAFDTVPHRRLIGKLKSYGVSGEILSWVMAFLYDRNQVVKVNGTESDSAPVISGIPQGSVLGPLLFVIYINDLPELLNSESFMFADDTKLFRTITSKSDAVALQSDLDALQEWSEKWLLRFNPDKCHVLTLGKFENTRYTHRYKLDHHELEHVFKEKDLGVTIDSNLTFDEHISEKIKKANAIVGLIRRTFSFLDGPLFKKLYTTFVRPHLEYAQAVWSPHLTKYVRMLENVQIRATKLVDGFKNIAYPDRLRKLDLPTLEYRRSRGDMIEVYKHLHTYDQLTIPPHFRRHTRASRKHNYQLIWNKPKDGIRGLQSNSFYYRVITRWNNLPRNVVDATNINIFKRELDKALTSNEQKYIPS